PMAHCSEPFLWGRGPGGWLLTAARSGWRTPIATQPRHCRSAGQFIGWFGGPLLRRLHLYVESDSSKHSRFLRLFLAVWLRTGPARGNELNQESRADRHTPLVPGQPDHEFPGEPVSHPRDFRWRQHLGSYWAKRWCLVQVAT